MRFPKVPRTVALGAVAVLVAAVVAIGVVSVLGISALKLLATLGEKKVPRVVLGLGIALSFAVLAAHPKVKAVERRLGITVLLSTGVPFLAMGAIFARDDVGILTADVLTHMRPAFEFGLGWMGFVVGLNLDVRRFDRMHRSIGRMVAVASLVPFVTTAVLCSIALVGLKVPFRNVEFARDALVLAACAAPSAPVSIEFLARRLGAKGAEYIHDITQLDELLWLPVLGFVAAFFRPSAEVTQWVLPPAAWLLVTMGLGGVLGILTYLLMRGAQSAGEELALLLGAVALSAGITGYLALSVPVVCAIAGGLLANLPMRDTEGFRNTLIEVERPLYLIFLLIVGAAWKPGEWQGWVIAFAFVLARVAGKRLGAIWSRRIGPRDLPPPRELALALAPQSPITVVAIVSVATQYQEQHAERMRWCINAVIIGGVLTEIVIRVLERLGTRTAHEAPAAPSPAEEGSEA